MNTSSLLKNIGQRHGDPQGKKSHVVDSAWKITTITNPIKQQILNAFYRGLDPVKISKNFYDPRYKCPPVSLICAVIRANSRPERIH